MKTFIKDAFDILWQTLFVGFFFGLSFWFSHWVFIQAFRAAAG